MHRMQLHYREVLLQRRCSQAEAIRQLVAVATHMPVVHDRSKLQLVRHVRQLDLHFPGGVDVREEATE